MNKPTKSANKQQEETTAVDLVKRAVEKDPYPLKPSKDETKVATK